MTGRRVGPAPWWLITAGCLVVAAAYLVVWPQDRADDASELAAAALRWLHPAAWLLFAAAATCHGLGGPARAVRACTTAAGLCYAGFAAALLLG